MFFLDTVYTAGSKGTLCQMGDDRWPWSYWNGRFGDRTRDQNMQLLPSYKNDFRFIKNASYAISQWWAKVNQKVIN